MERRTLEEILPLGSIITLFGGTKKIMICGRIQEDGETGKIYDYSACLYPEGLINPKELYLFHQKDIEKVYFLGLQDSEEFAFRSFMEEKLIELGLLTS